MRRSGRTFRVLLRAMLLASTSNNKKGVVVYANNNAYARQLFHHAQDMMMSYGNFPDVTSTRHNMTITFPNDKKLIFKSTQDNTREKRMGIAWAMYDELSDQYEGEPMIEVREPSDAEKILESERRKNA